MARALVEKAGKAGKLTEASLVAAVGKYFVEADKNKDGLLDERELTEELNKLLAMPGFGPRRGQPFGPPGDRQFRPRPHPEDR